VTVWKCFHFLSRLAMEPGNAARIAADLDEAAVFGVLERRPDDFAVAEKGLALLHQLQQGPRADGERFQAALADAQRRFGEDFGLNTVLRAD
jgi:hypothetical protein